MKRAHAMPFGAEPLDGGGVRFNLWAPGARSISALLYGPEGRETRLSMQAGDGGWYGIEVAEAGPGTRYHYLLEDGLRVPDPASRFQPEDVHGPSEVVDPGAWRWTDQGWRSRPWEEVVTYELHVGAFTPEGTFRSATRRLDHLAELGVTAVELMPVAEFPGTRNWGYDGVLPFAPDAVYGRPEDLKAFVAAAHARKLMVFLDVVYNHFGPEGNYLHAYAPAFFTERYHTPWGAAIDFEDPESRPVREFFIHNALYWIEEFNMDGLRFDAVHAINDASEPDILTELAERVRAACDREIHLILENDLNAARRMRRDKGRPRLYTAQWNDDYHHAVHVLLTGEDGGYYADYADAPARHLGRTLAEGFSYQGETSAHRDGISRGEPSAGLPPLAFVNFIQNHDQIGNRAFGERIDASAERRAVEAAIAVTLLAPSPPLLFMGEEWAAPHPFPFFCDFHDELADKVREGRRREFARFPAFRDPAARERIPDPNAEETFRRAVLDWSRMAEQPHASRLRLCRTLLDLRHREIVPRLAGIQGDAAVFAVLRDRGVDVQWRLGDGSRLRLLANLGDAAAAGLPAPSGRLLYATGNAADEAARGVLPAWSVLWLLDEGPT